MSINNFWLLKHNNNLLVTGVMRNSFEKINGNEDQ